MFVKGENYQDLSKFLTRAESSKSEKQFFTFMMECQELDPENFTCMGKNIFGKSMAVIFGQHAKAKNKLRAHLTNDQLLTLVDQELANPLVASQIMDNSVYFDDEEETVIGFDDPDVTSTAVVKEGSNFILVYETGFRYIRVKTVWDIRMGTFFAQASTKVIKLKALGVVTTDMEEIPEVVMQHKKEGI